MTPTAGRGTPLPAPDNIAGSTGRDSRRNEKMANITVNAPAYVESQGFFARLLKAVEDYRLYRRTLAELESLSNRELADLGLSRFAIKQVAYDSVYGA